jgi:hypothetical protein
VLKDVRVARRLAVVGLLVIGLAMVIVAGMHNLRTRREAIQRAQQNEVVLAKADSPSDSEADPMGQPMLGKVAPAFTLVDGEKSVARRFQRTSDCAEFLGDLLWSVQARDALVSAVGWQVPGTGAGGARVGSG